MPFKQTLGATVGNTAQASTDTFAIGEAPFDGTVSGVTYAPESTLTGDATNNRTFTLVNKGQSGVGSTVVATLVMGAGVTATGFDEKAFTLSATPANLVVAEGDILALTTTAGGTGIADPGGRVSVEITRTIA